MTNSKFFILILIFLVSRLFAQEIDKEMIKNSEIISGLEFTDQERDSMIADLEQNRKDFNTIRQFKLENSVPPALVFNPVPAGFEFEKIRQKIKYSNYSNTKLPDDHDELAFYSVGRLAELIRTGKITSVELTRFFLDRFKKYGDSLRCVITLTEKLAIEQARKADKEIAEGKYRGMLHGIPYGAKDLLSVKGYKTTWGAMPYKDQVINENAAVIKKLEEAGAVLIAKLTMGALAWGDVWFGGKTRNPWDISEGSSGSSAGSASATAAGLVPFAIGTETWGSIVAPSTVCGVTGLRPTYGRVSRTGAMALSWSMDKIGPICRNAEDLAIVFDVLRGPDSIDQTLFDVPFNYTPDIDIRELKVGYLKNDFDENYPFHHNDSLALNDLRVLGVKLIPVELPDIDVSAISFILSAEAAAAFDELTRSNKDDLLVRQIRNAWPNVFRASRFIPAVEYINANRIRYKLIQQMNDLMNEVNILVAPSWDGDNLLLTNLTGHPCVVVPNGFSEEGNSSISFIGRLFDEGTLISFAKLYQDATGHHLKHPDMTMISN